MLTEWDWYEEMEELLHASDRGEWNRLVNQAILIHRHHELDENKSDQQVEEVLHGLLRKLQGYPPTWMVIAGPDGEIKTPDDIWIEPAWNIVEVQHAWDEHDGRNHGTLVVGVYIWSFQRRAWTRDHNWGIMGHEGQRGPADDEDPGDRICE
jgi:hypothetical protein